MGHRDTVFPKGEPARRPFQIEDGRAYGPGVCDMKAGLVMNAFVLAAFQKFGGAPAPLIGLFTSDEEIGSPACRPIIEATARAARAVFNCEPGRPSGNVVTGRKGGVFMKMEVIGKAAHSGGELSRTASAPSPSWPARSSRCTRSPISTKGTTLNVGLVSGGQSVNTVAPWAKCEIDLRYVSRPIARSPWPGSSGSSRRRLCPARARRSRSRGEFKPLVRGRGVKRAVRALCRRARATSASTVAGEFSGGCADSGFTASVGRPTVCAVGPVGGKAHSPEEFMVVDSIVPRAQALALAVARLSLTYASGQKRVAPCPLMSLSGSFF